ncbi:50S ribosomal protein L21 [Gracilariopsis chorda]|uniref:Large ribosomal subunit protein bL21m n=1 Tax=Gracilariopsis chorda TaxID=448386 RepID=A0A2V3J4V8_9FLOR|nr:50S ribosomal protein L21 [Gracilariopsis chorda]|eukprot:PXF49037.1 50S ribosomal protein L21 [Gracilariopsis chorda]
MIRTPSKSLPSVLTRFQKAITHRPSQSVQRLAASNIKNDSFQQFKFLAQQRTIQSVSSLFNCNTHPSRRSLQPRGFASASDAQNTYHGDESDSTVEKPIEIERVPLPPGLKSDKFGLYEVLDTSKDMRETKGENAVVAIHGPPEIWLPRGIEEHGASGGLWAVIGTSGTQYKVMKGDVLYTNRQAGEVNTQVAFDWVLAIGAFDWTLFGRPLIRGAKVLATVEEQTKSAKVMVAKFKKRKGYLRRKGHRQPITRFRIDEIVYQWPAADMIKPHEVKYDPEGPPMPHHIRPL